MKSFLVFLCASALASTLFAAPNAPETTNSSPTTIPTVDPLAAHSIRVESTAPPYTSDVLPLTPFRRASDPLRSTIRGHIYLWWVAYDRDTLDLLYSYTPLHKVEIEVYDIFGRRIHETVETCESLTNGSSDSDDQCRYSFEFDVDGAMPIVLIFDANASFVSRTPHGESVADTFMPTVIWIAGSSTTDPTLLHIAIPTVGQLYSIGGGSTAAIEQQLSLMEYFLSSNVRALERWETRLRSVRSTADTIAEVAVWDWDVFRDAGCSVCPDMVEVPSGSFDFHDLKTGIKHPIRFDDFAVSVGEITVREFMNFVQEADYRPDDDCWDRAARTRIEGGWRGFEQAATDPVSCVSWNDARAYVDWLSEKTGATYRLLSLTEAARLVDILKNNLPGSEVMKYNGVRLGEDWAWWVQDCSSENDKHEYPLDGSPWEVDGCEERRVFSPAAGDNKLIIGDGHPPGLSSNKGGLWIARSK